MKSKLFVQWCVSTQFVGANGYKGKKGLTEEGGSQIIFVVKLKKLKNSWNQQLALVKAVLWGLAMRGWVGGGLSLQKEAWDQPSQKFPASLVQPYVLLGVFIFIYSIPSQTGPSWPEWVKAESFRLLPKTFLKVCSDAKPSNVYVLTELRQEL